VHSIMCAQPGLSVTSDPHRRSGLVRRLIIWKLLVNSLPPGQQLRTVGGRKRLALYGRTKKKCQRYGPLKTTISIVARDLFFLPSSHVNVLKTRVHGDRMRGHIAWEEELAIQMDRRL